MKCILIATFIIFNCSFIALAQNGKPTYHFDSHGNFNVFWWDFRNAVLSGDKDAVAKMTNFPLSDSRNWGYSMGKNALSNAGNQAPTTKSLDDFIRDYDSLFVKDIVSLIDTGVCSRCRAHAGEPKKPKSLLPNCYDLSVFFQGSIVEINFKKKEGVYKLYSIANLE